MIVKIQRPLGSSEPNPPALVYDQSRRYHAAVAMSADILAALDGRAKVYCEASVTAGKLVVGRRVDDQPW